MLKVKRNLVVLLAIIMVVGLTSIGFAAQKEFVAIATGGTGGTYYPVGGALAQMITDNLDGIIVTAQSGNASRAGCNLIGRGQIETAFSQANVTYWSYTGTGIYENEPVISNLRGIASIYPETIQIFARKGSGIKTMEDLRGKKVGVGAPNSGNVCDAEIIFAFHGLTFDDIIPEYIDYNEMAQRFIDGQIDACFFTTGYPSSSIMNMESKRELQFIPLDTEKIKGLVEKYPYYGAVTIPTGIYKSNTEPVQTVATPALWICDAKLSPTLVYKMTKALWEHRDVLEKVHFQGKNITLETALDGMGIPLHPGAELYYKEIGLIK
jgi:TRAP transporter TAXI family solute receptor